MANSKSKLSPNDILFNKLKRKYSLTKKLRVQINQFLQKGDKENEEIDIGSSRANKNYCVVVTKTVTYYGYTTSRRRFFCKRNKDKLTFLYDEKSLIEDYESGHSCFKRFRDENPDIYHHLAIAYLDGSGLLQHKESHNSLKEFIKRSPYMKGDNVKETIIDYAYLFHNPAILSFSGWFFCFLEMGMINEAALTYTAMSECFVSDDKLRHGWYGYSYLLLEQFSKSEAFLGEGIERLTEHVKEKERTRYYPNFNFYEFNQLKDNLTDWKSKFYWAAGMKRWHQNKKELACKNFQNAIENINDDNPMNKLMDYLLNTVTSGEKPLCMSEQIPLLLKWHEEKKKREQNKEALARKIEAVKKEATTQVSKDIDGAFKEVVSSVENPLSQFKDEQLQYDLWVPKEDGVGCKVIAKLSEKDLENKLSSLKQKYKLLIDDRYKVVYVNGEKVGKVKVPVKDRKTNKNKYKLLDFKSARYNLFLHFIKNKDRLIQIPRLYKIGWPNIDRIDYLPDNYKESLKNEKRKLISLLKVTGMSDYIKIEPERGVGYTCEVNCDFCLIKENENSS